MQAVRSLILREFGALHYRVNNAGMSGYFEGVADLSFEKWNEVITVNLSSLFYSMKYEIRSMLAAGGGFLAGRSRCCQDRGQAASHRVPRRACELPLVMPAGCGP
jgi:NAD(P)-dependent dehydrogenase (short-subunit alcohol dehydrogenase family)